MRLYARQLSYDLFVGKVVKKMFVSKEVFENYQKMKRPHPTPSHTKTVEKICESPKKTFPVFDYDGRACPNAPLKTGKSKYLDAETQLIRKSLFK